MTNLLILAAAAATPSPATAAATASTVVLTAPHRNEPEWLTGETALRYRLRELPPAPPSGPKNLAPRLRLTF